MGYLTNSGSGFLSNAVTTVSNVKSYLVNKTGYLVDSIRVGIGDFGQRVLDDGGTVEASAEAAASYREITKDIYDQASLVLFPSGYKDNLLYSHKPTNGSGDFTYTRGTDTATRVGADGYIKKERANLLEQSNQFDTTWNLSGGSTLNQNAVGIDNIPNTAWTFTKDSTFDGIKQNISKSGINTFSVYAKKIDSSVNELVLRINVAGGNRVAIFDLSNGTKVSMTSDSSAVHYDIQKAGNGWYRCSFVVSGTIANVDIRMDYNQTGTGSMLVQNAQLEEGLVATSYIETTTAPVYEGLTDNLPRIDYTGGTPSILLEPSRTNLVGQSEYIDSWNDYTNGNGATPTITTNYIESPEGIVNATRLQLETNGTSSTDASGVLQSIALDGSSTYIFSFWIKSNSGSSAELSTFINSSFGVQFTATTEWQRLDFELVSNSTNPRNFGIVARGNYHQSVDVSFWGAQLEQGSYPTSYIPTYGSSATRNGEQIVNTNISSIINTSNSYTIFFDFTRPNADYFSAWQLIGIDNGGYTSRLKIVQRPNFDQFRVNVYDGTTNATSSEIDNSAQNKIAVVYDGSTSYKIFTNGTLLQTLSCGAINGTRLTSGENGTQRTIDNYQQISLFPTALSDNECIALTTP